MIEINNLTNSFIEKGLLEKAAKIVLEGEKQKIKDLSIALVGQGKIKKLNKKYRGKNRATDVLAFGDSDGLREVVICLSEVKKNAKHFSSNYKAELVKVLIHGILHLLGYDHEESSDKANLMEKKQDYYLAQAIN